MTPRVVRHDLRLVPDAGRVILRPFVPGNPRTVVTILGRALALTEAEVEAELARVHRSFGPRHGDIDALLAQNFGRVADQVFTQRPLSRARQLLVGALFSGEYALEAAALFNPSIVAAPDQAGVADGELRIVMSLRATGEGHVSSIEFRSGTVKAGGDVVLDPESQFVTAPNRVPDPHYLHDLFREKLHEMGFANDATTRVLGPLGPEFSRSDLDASVARVRREIRPIGSDVQHTFDAVQWLADSNYELRFRPDQALSERILFPVSANESNGMEDARFVRFVDDAGAVVYYATYTAYNGRSILPQFIETQDFFHFKVLTLNGGAVHNKGMALFPRKVNGRYAMLSRQDDENILLMFSDNLHHWADPQVLVRPAEIWESVKIGNCGSPLETRAGWLVITHGVGPLRQYCLGAVLLALDDPTRVLGRLHEPLLAPEEADREGYVPNVVYSCGSLVHQGRLILPYAMSDKVTSLASVDLEELLTALGQPLGTS
jgi:predicted GH43/DUF377 family glycosyl hydrolase